MHMFFRLAASLAFVLACTSASNAQTLYRCGKTYQDRPCEGAVEGVAVGKARATVAPASQVNAACAQQGSEANRIMWIKEGGRTEQEQMTEARSKGGSPDFIRYVYGKRGSAAEVRTQVEADCMADIEKGRSGRNWPMQSSGAISESAVPGAARGSVISSSQQSIGQQGNADQCRALQDQANATKSAQRAGGSPSAMETMGQQLRSIDNRRRALGC